MRALDIYNIDESAHLNYACMCMDTYSIDESAHLIRACVCMDTYNIDEIGQLIHACVCWTRLCLLLHMSPLLLISIRTCSNHAFYTLVAPKKMSVWHIFTAAVVEAALPLQVEG